MTSATACKMLWEGRWAAVRATPYEGDYNRVVYKDIISDDSELRRAIEDVLTTDPNIVSLIVNRGDARDISTSLESFEVVLAELSSNMGSDIMAFLRMDSHGSVLQPSLRPISAVKSIQFIPTLGTQLRLCMSVGSIVCMVIDKMIQDNEGSDYAKFVFNIYLKYMEDIRVGIFNTVVGRVNPAYPKMQFSPAWPNDLAPKLVQMESFSSKKVATPNHFTLLQFQNKAGTQVSMSVALSIARATIIENIQDECDGTPGFVAKFLRLYIDMAETLCMAATSVHYDLFRLDTLQTSINTLGMYPWDTLVESSTITAIDELRWGHTISSSLIAKLFAESSDKMWKLQKFGATNASLKFGDFHQLDDETFAFGYQDQSRDNYDPAFLDQFEPHAFINKEERAGVDIAWTQ